MSEPLIVKNADSYDLDTREKLEADVRQYANPGDYKNTLGASWEKKMLSFLDRQAAITEREQTDKWQHLAFGNELLEADKMALQDSVDELTAERDTLQGALDIAVQNESKLEAERDELREALDACGTGTMYELWRSDNAQLEAFRAALHDKPGNLVA